MFGHAKLIRPSVKIPAVTPLCQLVRRERKLGWQNVATRRPGTFFFLPSADSSTIIQTATSIQQLPVDKIGYVWQQQIDAGQFEGLDDVAQAKRGDHSYMGRVLQLTSLAPDIVEPILVGNT
ncbi:MAG TPA: hypothetical protein PKD64_11515 [Pirellulaceae bacterium]|nr:hypothetical protein [Pirellulaceae bacterium]HMO92811.1 hypothetical protein [Pirellulaceae bacterium]HMP69446.1 hypothetical protein [Pirellulaceae bacterium]